MTQQTDASERYAATLARLRDLHQQATTERSHYYVGSVCVEAEAALLALRADNKALREALEKILAANAEFRSVLPATWESDPLNDACEAARAALASALPDPKENKR